MLELLNKADAYFTEKGLDSPRLSSELLLAHVLGCERIGLYIQFESTVEGENLQRFRDLVRRRASGEPVAYILGGKEFYSLDFKVDPSVLIPRPETETLVSEALRILGDEGPKIVCDLGTGSGAVAVAIAHNRPDVRLSAVDASASALGLARENAARAGVSDRIAFYEGDLFEPVKGMAFDMIVSNPPYVAESEFPSLSVEIRDFEPRQALVAGAQGTEAIRRILEGAGEHLVAGGALLMEMGAGQSGNVCDLAGGCPEFSAPSLVRDMAGIERVIVLHKENR